MKEIEKFTVLADDGSFSKVLTLVYDDTQYVVKCIDLLGDNIQAKEYKYNSHSRASRKFNDERNLLKDLQ